jgi:nucleoside-diphosphate-sugar epimerase
MTASFFKMFFSDWGRPADYESTNFRGTALLLDAAVAQMRKAESSKTAPFIRFVHVSTTDVYGYPAAGAGDESTPLVDTGLPYNRTKVLEELSVVEYQKSDKLPTTIIRPVNVYGPRGRDFVVEVLDNILAGTGPLVGGGNHPCGITYVDHVVAATVRSATLPKAVNEVYNVMDVDEPLLTWRTFGNAMADAAKARRPWLYIPFFIAFYLGWFLEIVYGIIGKFDSRPLLTRHAAYILGHTAKCDASKAVRELGYPCVAKPVSLEEGVRRSVDWYFSSRKKKNT